MPFYTMHGGPIRPTDPSVRVASMREKTATKELDFNERLLAWYKSIYGDISKRFAGGEGATEVPGEFAEAEALYQPGGQFGAGGRAEIQRGGQEALAAGQIGAMGTGMSSGTNIAALGARVSADTAMARKKIQDERVRLLSGSLQTSGAARLETARLNQARQLEMLRTMSSFRPSFT